MKHILVIDDNKSVYEALDLILTNHDCVCELISDPTDALDLLIRHQTNYDIIFCDYNMPCMTGATLASTLRQRNISRLIVGMSGNTANKLQFQSVGIYLFLNKPFDLKNVLELLDRIG